MLRDLLAFVLVVGLISAQLYWSVGKGGGALGEERQQLYFVRAAAEPGAPPLDVTPADVAELLPGAKLVAVNAGEWPFTPEIRGLWVTLVVPSHVTDETVFSALGSVEGAEGCSIYR